MRKKKPTWQFRRLASKELGLARFYQTEIARNLRANRLDDGLISMVDGEIDRAIKAAFDAGKRRRKQQ